MFTERELGVLREAERSGGWALGRNASIARLKAGGYFMQAWHPQHGLQPRLTEAGQEVARVSRSDPAPSH